MDEDRDLEKGMERSYISLAKAISGYDVKCLRTSRMQLREDFYGRQMTTAGVEVHYDSGNLPS